MGLVSRQHLDADVDFYVLWLEDASETSNGSEPDGEVPFVSSCDGRVYIRSGGHTHTADFAVEVWDQMPQPDPGPWEDQGEAELRVPSGEVVLWTYGGSSEGEIDVGSPGRNWHVRIYVTGQQRVHELAQQGETPKGVERYLAQFWPM